MYRMREASVTKKTGVGVRILFVVAVVSEGVFKTFFGCVPADLDMRAVAVLGIDGKPFTGVIMQFVEPWPVQLPHIKMELYCDQSRERADILLNPQWNLRKSQAKDRFALACKHMEEKNDKCLKMSSLPDLMTLDRVQVAATKLQDDRKQSRGFRQR